MEPTIEETRIINAVGKNMNLVASESEYIVRGVVTSINSYPKTVSNGRSLIYSDVEFNVTKVLSGKLEPGPILINIAGGEINGVKLEVSSMPKFKMGQDSILYLKKIGNTWKVTRGNLGKVNI